MTQTFGNSSVPRLHIKICLVGNIRGVACLIVIELTNNDFAEIRRLSAVEQNALSLLSSVINCWSLLVRSDVEKRLKHRDAFSNKQLVNSV